MTSGGAHDEVPLPGSAEIALEVDDLRVQFPTQRGVVQAVDGLSFKVRRGEILGIVGESGSGKSVTALSVMRLLRRPGRINGGRILFNGRDLLKASESEMQRIRGAEIAMVFQDPMTSLNPVIRTGWQVGEPLWLHQGLTKAKAYNESVRLLARVDIPDSRKRAEQYPHEFSGGMRQRAMIAMALSLNPTVLIADEPTTALDVTIQAQILDLLRDVNRSFGTAIVLITHNFGVVAGMCDRVVVMYAGRVVEEGPTSDVFATPKHPYTWSLLRSLPRLDKGNRVPLKAIDGSPPDLANLPGGCKFHPRCQFRIDRCLTDEPQLESVSGSQQARCWVTQAGEDLPASPAASS
jgi:oligopeptide/dipeptide ABC transporter ATP-binding protein